jgi:hypothetical protein
VCSKEYIFNTVLLCEIPIVDLVGLYVTYCDEPITRPRSPTICRNRLGKQKIRGEGPKLDYISQLKKKCVTYTQPVTLNYSSDIILLVSFWKMADSGFFQGNIHPCISLDRLRKTMKSTVNVPSNPSDTRSGSLPVQV